jgi:hypothetical protein
VSRSSKETKRVYGPAARRHFVASLPCIICARVPSQNAHSRTGGMGRKADKETIVPMCALHHAEYDGAISGGRQTFLATHQVTQEWVYRMADLTERLWQEHVSPRGAHAPEP